MDFNSPLLLDKSSDPRNDKPRLQVYGTMKELDQSTDWQREYVYTRQASEAGQHVVTFSRGGSNEAQDGAQGQSELNRNRCMCTCSLLESQWPLVCFIAVTFLGAWLPQKRRSKWPLTILPLCLLLLGISAHFYFVATAGHQKVHIGSKILLSSLWISGLCSYCLALHHFAYRDQEYLKDLIPKNWRWINISLLIGILLVSWILFGDAYYQVIFDLVHIKDALLTNCHRKLACNAVFFILATSVYWGLYSSVAVCCVFYSVCQSMCNRLSKGYLQITQCTVNVRETIKLHAEIREGITEMINGIKTWFIAHLLFYIVALLANIYVWWEAATMFRHAYEFVAQVSGTLIVAYKFFFPFISASYVTWHESNLAQELNDKVDFEPHQTFYCRRDLEVFLKQSKRRGYGFRLYNIQITLTIAIFSLFGSLAGLAHNFM